MHIERVKVWTDSNLVKNENDKKNFEGNNRGVLACIFYYGDIHHECSEQGIE